MNNRVVTEYGKSRKEAELNLRKKHPGSEIFFEREYRKGWKFWSKEWEIKALLEEKKAKPEKEVPVKVQKKGNKVEAKESDERKAALLKMLSNSEDESSLKENEQKIQKLMQTVDSLIAKIETDVHKKDIPLPLEKMETYLKEQEIDHRTARIYVEKVGEKLKNSPVIEENEVNEGIRSLIENQINVMGPLKIEDKKIICVIGPTGVGKTTTLAKIGWEYTKKERTIGFITTDTFRSGAKEQLEKYAEKMDAETMVAKSAKELKEAIQYFQNVNKVDHILIDTVGRNPRVDESVQSVKEYLEIAKPKNENEMLTCLVLSSTSKVRDLKETLNRFKDIKVNAMIFTKLDETFNVGSILNVFNFTKLPLLYVTDGQDITKNIYAPTKRMISEKILNKEAELEGKILA